MRYILEIIRTTTSIGGFAVGLYLVYLAGI